MGYTIAVLTIHSAGMSKPAHSADLNLMKKISDDLLQGKRWPKLIGPCRQARRLSMVIVQYEYCFSLQHVQSSSPKAACLAVQVCFHLGVVNVLMSIRQICHSRVMKQAQVFDPTRSLEVHSAAEAFQICNGCMRGKFGIGCWQSALKCPDSKLDCSN